MPNFSTSACIIFANIPLARANDEAEWEDMVKWQGRESAYSDGWRTEAINGISLPQTNGIFKKKKKKKRVGMIDDDHW